MRINTAISTVLTLILLIGLSAQAGDQSVGKWYSGSDQPYKDYGIKKFYLTAGLARENINGLQTSMPGPETGFFGPRYSDYSERWNWDSKHDYNLSFGLGYMLTDRLTLDLNYKGFYNKEGGYAFYTNVEYSVNQQFTRNSLELTAAYAIVPYIYPVAGLSFMRVTETIHTLTEYLNGTISNTVDKISQNELGLILGFGARQKITDNVSLELRGYRLFAFFEYGQAFGDDDWFNNSLNIGGYQINTAIQFYP